MANETVYLVKLEYKSGAAGGGSMTLQLAVDPMNNTLSGRADGTILEGTQHAPSFMANGSGHIHSTGIKEYTKVGAVSGQAMVTVPPPAIGSYLAPFTASFSVNDDWNGNGMFSVGTNTYECKVIKAD